MGRGKDERWKPVVLHPFGVESFENNYRFSNFKLHTENRGSASLHRLPVVYHPFGVEQLQTSNFKLHTPH